MDYYYIQCTYIELMKLDTRGENGSANPEVCTPQLNLEEEIYDK